MQIIQHTELSSAQSSITFSSIPQTYTDLMLVISARGSFADTLQDVSFRFNGSTSGYSARSLFGNGSSTSSYSEAETSIRYTITSPAANATSNTFGNAQVYIPNYTASTNKSVSVDSVGENNATLANQKLSAALWSNTAAITSISIFNSTTLAAGSSATLYGILKGSSGGVTVS